MFSQFQRFVNSYFYAHSLEGKITFSPTEIRHQDPRDKPANRQSPPSPSLPFYSIGLKARYLFRILVYGGKGGGFGGWGGYSIGGSPPLPLFKRKRKGGTNKQKVSPPSFPSLAIAKTSCKNVTVFLPFSDRKFNNVLRRKKFQIQNIVSINLASFINFDRSCAKCRLYKTCARRCAIN